MVELMLKTALTREDVDSDETSWHDEETAQSVVHVNVRPD